MAATTVGLCALALTVAMASAAALIESVMTDRIDDQLRATAESFDPVRDPGSIVVEGEPPFQPASTAGVPEAPTLMFFNADGTARPDTKSEDDAERGDHPDLPDLPDLAGHAADGGPFTVDDELGNPWRILAVDADDTTTEGGDGYAVFALSVLHVEGASESLLLIGGAVTLGVLVLLAVGAMWVVGIGLRPLDRMAATASRITDGRLDERVADDDADPHTETGRLGKALNTMLSRQQSALDDRADSERRLRQFLTDASHELRTPLTSITGFAQLYRHGGAPPGPDLDEAIGRIEGESRRMRLLLDDLTLLAALDERRPDRREPVDLLGVCADVVGDAHLREPARPVSLEPLEPPGDEPSDALMEPVTVIGDEARLRQIVTNLVANALRYTDEHVRISVRVGRDNTPGPAVLAQVGSTPSAPRAVVEVADTGAGIAPEHAEAVFERLYRVDQARTRGTGEGGSGLGLSIVAAIATGHGGCVRLSDTPGGGATFRVLLP